MSYRTTWPSYSGGLPASLGHSGGPVAGSGVGEIWTEYFDILESSLGENVWCVWWMLVRGGVWETIQCEEVCGASY